MSNVKINDIATIGKSGKVEYIVRNVEGDTVALESIEKGTKRKSTVDKVVVIKSFEPTPVAGDTLNIANAIAVKNAKGLTLIIDGHATKTYNSFETAAFDLSRLKGTYRTAIIARLGRRVVERAA